MKYIKKERPEAGTSKRSVRGLASENDCKKYYNRFLGKSKLLSVREEVNLL